MIKVLFVYSDRTCHCTLKRTFEVCSALKQYKSEDITANILYFQNLKEEHIVQHDIVLFQRLGANKGMITDQFQSFLFEMIEKYQSNKKFIYDLDDLVFNEQNKFPIAIMKKCHWALAPNTFLANKMSEINPNTYIIRTHLDLIAFERATAAVLNKNDIFNIGWFSIAREGQNVVKSMLSNLEESIKKKINLYFVGIPLANISSQIISHHILPTRKFYGLAKAMDIIINPFDIDNISQNEIDFVHSKSEIKFALAGAAGIPLLVTPSKTYQEVIQHGQNGFLLDSPRDWAITLSNLIEDKHLKSSVGSNAKTDVYNKYGFESVANNYHQFFTKVLNR